MLPYPPGSPFIPFSDGQLVNKCVTQPAQPPEEKAVTLPPQLNGNAALAKEKLKGKGTAVLIDEYRESLGPAVLNTVVTNGFLPDIVFAAQWAERWC